MTGDRAERAAESLRDRVDDEFIEQLDSPKFKAFKARLLQNPRIRRGYDEARARRDGGGS